MIRDATFGVTLGGILSLLLFAVYVYDLPAVIAKEGY